MLVTDPKQRASLHEIMNHPWMTKGFGAPPDNYLPPREPLQLPLDPAVIQAMTGFDFGAPELIRAQLTKVIESDDYQRAVRIYTREREYQTPNNEKKRGFGFDFYKRRNSTTSRDTLNTPSVEGLQLGADPINAFNPLISVYYLVREKQERDRQAANPGATSMPRIPGEAPLQQVPDLVAPKAAHTNAATYEMPGEKATGGRSRPRARTHGEDEVTDSMKHVRIAGPGGTSGPVSPAVPEPPAEQAVRKESTAAGLLRRFSTRRRKDPERTDRLAPPPPVVRVNSPGDTTSSLKKSFSVRRTRDRERDTPSNSDLRTGAARGKDGDLLTPTRTSEMRNTGKIGRSASVNSTDFRRRQDRRGASEATSKDPPANNGSDEANLGGSGAALNEKTDREVEQKTNLNARAATTRAKSLGHARRESIQARRARREELREANVPEETDMELAEHSGVSTERIESAENVKPVFLKGLFSVSTTSTKPIQTIRADIIRVLRQLGVEYSEIRGGFSCRHVPSIDLNKIVDNAPQSPQGGNGFGSGSGHRRRISFGGRMGGGDRDRDDFREAERAPQTPRTPRRMDPDRSFTNSDASDESLDREPTSSHRPPPPGETTTHVQSDLGGSMILDFEIFIVKVPLLSLHGIQFKRLAGGTWQYKNMADAILRELRL
jgi:hypothetical protein